MELRPVNGAEAYGWAAEGNWLELFPGAIADEDDLLWIWERYSDGRDLLTLRSLWRIAHALAPH
ncbi:hypothetical protein AB0O47_39330, partial [Streptomyces noursei]